MEKHRGWWALAGMIVLPIVLYIGAYYAVVGKVQFADQHGEPIMVGLFPACEWLNLGEFFEPVYRLDRIWIRPDYWEP